MTAQAAAAFPVSRVPVVNVATVPQRSPLRYPGGKTWLIPHIRKWLQHTRPEILIEPFAGGAIVSLTAVMEDLADSAVMVEIDRDVAAFWRSALESGEILQQWISQFDPTLERLREIEQSPPENVVEHGFRTLVLNRTRRGGVLAKGASFIKAGENGKGLLSRWYPETLAGRLADIQEYSGRLSFVEGDGMKLLPILLRGWGRDAAVFVDPPYTAAGGKMAGSRLYEHSNVDHASLFEMLATHRSNFLMTYDAAPEIVALVHKHGFHAAALAMKNGHHNKLVELVITPAPLFA
ncbi:MAG: DNA adenine methylase [Rhodospirillaceae bacterium]|nr:DNA adenine methylase [Rhodospirillaceae bacterium]